MKYVYKIIYEIDAQATKEIDALQMLGWEIEHESCRCARIVLRKGVL